MGPKTILFVVYDEDSTVAIHFTMTMILMSSFAANPTNSVRGTASCNLSVGVVVVGGVSTDWKGSLEPWGVGNPV